MAVGARTVGMARRVSAVAGDGARLHLVLPERRQRLSDRSSLRQSPAAAPSPGCPPRVGTAGGAQGQSSQRPRRPAGRSAQLDEVESEPARRASEPTTSSRLRLPSRTRTSFAARSSNGLDRGTRLRQHLADGAPLHRLRSLRLAGGPGGGRRDADAAGGAPGPRRGPSLSPFQFAPPGSSPWSQSPPKGGGTWGGGGGPPPPTGPLPNPRRAGP